MKSYCWILLFLLLLILVRLSFPIGFCKNPAYQSLDGSCHDDHLNDATDDFPNDYAPLVIPIESGKQITVAPVTTCTCFENGTWKPNYHPCKMAQTLLTDNDWADGNANYTYIFEDWTDYDWNDIVLNLYTSITSQISSEVFLAFREAAWKNPLSLEIAAEGTWTRIEWNSTDYPDTHSLTVREGETVELDLFGDSNASDKAFVRFMIPPFADFALQPAEPFAGKTVMFDASASYDVDGEIDTYSWSFGDGASVNTNNPTTAHGFVSPGTYCVNLTIIDSDGLKDTISKQIEVVAVIGGETTALDNTLITTWRSANTLLIIGFVTVAALLQRKKKHPARLAG